MNRTFTSGLLGRALAGLAVLVGLVAGSAAAAIPGVTGTSVTLTAKPGRIIAGDGQSIYTWGLAVGEDGPMQYPGPTLIVPQGETVSITLRNQLPEPVSLIFPGQGRITTEGGAPGPLAQEAPPGGTVTYTFQATHAGTYLYQSGSHADLQVEMGLVGALIVRPSDYSAGSNKVAYSHPDARYDREYLFFLTDMDKTIHDRVEDMVRAGQPGPYMVDTTRRFPAYWFINGRMAPDTMAEANEPGADPFPSQPYNSMPGMHPGERLLMRVIGAGLDPHPFHHHGNHARTVARNGRLLQSAPGAGADLAVVDFTIPTMPGETYDAIYEWTGKGLGWDIYGHTDSSPGTCLVQHGEDCDSHGKPFPVSLPDTLKLTIGPNYSGSPFLGALGTLPPGEGGMNANGGLFFMWHSHNEKEMTNWNIFPGGMMTMVIIEPPGAHIME